VQSFDAIVLAGASSRRLDGADKAMIDLGGRPMIDLVLAAVREAVTVVVAGPARPGIDGVRWCEERPPGGGPVAGLAAAVELVDADTVVVLAVDLPNVAPAVPALLAALDPAELAMINSAGRVNYLAAAWRTALLRERLHGLAGVDGASLRALTNGLAWVEVPDGGDWAVDCDTWDDVRRARLRRGTR
jgi:molybdopterin-guanine dinucleotide biosynthesis protein A